MRDVTGQDLIAGAIVGVWVCLVVTGLMLVANLSKGAAVALILGFGLGVVWPIVVLPPAWLVSKILPITARRWFPFFFDDEDDV